MATLSFKTLRLSARRPGAEDFGALRALHTDPGTMKTLSVDGAILSEDMSRAIFERHLRHWEQHDFGIWLFALSVTQESVGYCGLRNYELEGRSEIELFYGIHSKFFRQGFGTEMARAVVDIGLQELKLTSIIGFTLHGNTTSRAVMMKVGMHFEREMEHAGLPHALYRLSNSRRLP